MPKSTKAKLPRCSRCKKVRVLNPCRDCATPEEKLSTFRTTSQGKPYKAWKYPPLPEKYRTGYRD